MEVERSSPCNCVELLDDGRHDQAIRLQEYLSDPQTLLQLKNDSEHKLSITDYQLRLAKLKSQLYVASADINLSDHHTFVDKFDYTEPVKRFGCTGSSTQKEAIEIIIKERSGASVGGGGASKSMGSHLGLVSSVSNFFGDGGLLGKRDSTEAQKHSSQRELYPPRLHHNHNQRTLD
ncbi:hypothetical protein JHK84_051911 [Glycine max]|nr:hypothetical protein JHK84_051911 [Glycine max]